MPLQRRLPKRGFNSLGARYSAQITLSELASVGADTVDLLVLKQAGLISSEIRSVKVIASGSIKKSVLLKDLRVTQGARKEIEAAGGKVE